MYLEERGYYSVLLVLAATKKSIESKHSKWRDLYSRLKLNEHRGNVSNGLSTSSKIKVPKIPPHSNIISNQALYKIKTIDDGDYYCKAKISPCANEDKGKMLIKIHDLFPLRQ